MRAVITGASDGIGEALARHYARQDSTLALIRKLDGDLIITSSAKYTLASNPTTR